MLVDNFLQLQRDFQQTFGTEHGERVLKNLRSLCHYDETTFSTDPLELARNEGRRQVYLRINTLLTYSPEQAKAPAKPKGKASL